MTVTNITAPTITSLDRNKKKFHLQNSKLWTLNFSLPALVAKARIVFPVISSRTKSRSMGAAVLLAVEYCLQEHVIRDFLQFTVDRKKK